MAERPFRHLCPEADLRDAMTDDEFWAHVAGTLAGPDDPDPDDLAAWEDVLMSEPCSQCGSVGACAYDSEGRPLIHADGFSDDDEAAS